MAAEALVDEEVDVLVRSARRQRAADALPVA